MILKHNILALTLVLLALFQLSTQKTFPRLPLEVIQVMGSRAMRYHHFLWHNIRDLYPLLDEATQKAITEIGWEPPRTSTIYYPNGTTHANEENFSGEDFLYMHTQMIDQANEIIAKTPGVSMKKIVGFESTPAPDDPDYPVPCNYTIPGNENFTNLIVSMKTDDFYYNVIVPAEQALKDPEVLRRMNLGQLGSRIEYTVHQYMHIRFSKKTPFGIRQSTFNPAPNIDPKWDDLSYQWLIDFYASQVNPIFWRIHGWVNNVLEDWKKANGVTDIQWQHTWVGGPVANLSALLEVSANSENAKRDPAPPVNLDTGNTFTPVTSGDNNTSTGNNNARLLQDDEGHEGHEGHGGHMGMHNLEAMEKLVELLMKATAGKESGLHTPVQVTPVSEW